MEQPTIGRTNIARILGILFCIAVPIALLVKCADLASSDPVAQSMRERTTGDLRVMQNQLQNAANGGKTFNPLTGK